MDSGTAAIIGALIGAASVNMAKVVEHYLLRQRAAKYLAVRVVTTLDHFIAQCALVAKDKGSEMNADYEIRPLVPLPTLEFSKLEVDWKSIDPVQAFQVLSLTNHVAAGEQAVNAAYDPQVPPYHDLGESRFQFARLGLSANAIVNMLSVEHKLPAPIERQKIVGELSAIFAASTKRRKAWAMEIKRWQAQIAESEMVSKQAMRELQEHSEKPTDSR